MLRTIASTTRSGDVIFGTGFAATALLLAAARRLRRVVTVSMVLLAGRPRLFAPRWSEEAPTRIASESSPAYPAPPGRSTQPSGDLWKSGEQRRANAKALRIRLDHHLDLGRWLPQRFERLRKMIERDDVGDQRPGIDPPRIEKIEHEVPVRPPVTQHVLEIDLFEDR